MRKKAASKESSAKTKRYKQDPAFREKVLRSNTERYRRTARKIRNCLGNLKTLASFGTKRKCVTITTEQEVLESKPQLTFSVEQMAKVLGYHPVVMYGWHSKGKFPKPKVYVHGIGSRLQTVYTEPQARALIAVIGEHQVQSQYLRDFDTETIGKLKEAMQAK